MLAYRKDIDGLRALAVSLVILYHLDVTLISAGFIGVDIFFVLSGFLITTIIKKEVESNTFTYSSFYLKRIRRIYPLLLVVMLVTCVLGYFILLPENFYQLSKSSGLALISLSNFYFNNISSGYFGENTSFIPLLHTWSLSIEEQFYLFWPIVLYYLITNRNTKHISGKIILVLTLIVAIISQILAEKDPGSSYFLIYSRAFELLSGASLSLLWCKIPVLRMSLMNLLSAVAFWGLLSISIILDKSSTFPGYNAAVVCIFTCILIYTGQKPTLVSKFLGSKALTYIGLLSYSLYLWHWPIIAYTNYLSIDKTIEIQLIILAITTMLSILTFYTVEHRFRFTKKYSLKKSLSLFLAIPFIIISSFILITKETGGLTFRFSEIEKSMLAYTNSKYYSVCISDICNDDFSDKLNGHLDNSDFLLIGDSHASSIRGFVNYLANKANKKGTTYFEYGIPLLFGAKVYQERTTPQLDIDATSSTENFKRTIDNFKGSTVIISNRYSLYIHGRNETYNKPDLLIGYNSNENINRESSIENYRSSFKDTISYILDKGLDVIIIKPIPELGKDLSTCSILNTYNSFSDNRCSISANQVIDRNKIINDLLDDVDNKFENVSFIDIESLTCNNNSCFSNINGRPIYHDDNHLNYLGSKLLGEIFLSNNRNPLLNSIE